MRPNPGRSAKGPVWPKAEIRTSTSPGLTARRSSQPSPQRSSVPGRKFSVTTSACATRRLTSSWPSGTRRLQVTDLLFRDSASHQYDTPGPAGVPSRRRSSPGPGCSTLITSAPNSPRRVEQKGAATKVARSTTVSPSSARGVGEAGSGLNVALLLGSPRPRVARKRSTANLERGATPSAGRRSTPPPAATDLLYHRSVMAIFTDRVERAIAAAIEAHEGQTRKGDRQLPYVV